jgi:hypothetical protein
MLNQNSIGQTDMCLPKTSKTASARKVSIVLDRHSMSEEVNEEVRDGEALR